MIYIHQSKSADTRTCDVSTVDQETLLAASYQHIYDVHKGMDFFIELINKARYQHDHTKISHIGEFYDDFKTKFAVQNWYAMHKATERHYINSPDGVRSDVNVIDLIEHIVDCVMAGRGRSGSVYPFNLPNELLQRIVQNTADLLNNNVEVLP